MGRKKEDRVPMFTKLDRVAYNALYELSEQLELPVTRTLDKIILHYTKKGK